MFCKLFLKALRRGAALSIGATLSVSATFFLMSGAALSGAAFAQNLDTRGFIASDSANCLTFPEALRLGVSLDPALGEAQARQEIAQSELGIARADWRPRLSAYGRGSEGSSGLLDGRTDNQVGFTLSQRVFDFGQGGLNIGSAKARLKASEYESEATENASSYDTARVFLTVLEAQERLVAARNRETHFTAIIDTVKKRLNAGLITQAQASSTEAEYALAQANRIEEDLNLAQVRSRLFILTGQHVLPCSNMGNVVALLSTQIPQTLPQSIEAAMASHPQLMALASRKIAAGKEVKRENRRQLPVLEVEAASAYIYDDLFNRWERSERVGIDVSVPLWNGSRYSSGRQGARARRTEAEMALARSRRDIETRISLAWHDIEMGKHLIDSRARLRTSLETEAAAVRREVESGLRSYQDQEKVEADLQTAILQEIETKFLVYKQYLDLLSAMNRI